MREHQQAFREKHATLAAISLGDANYARLFQQETGIDFPLLIDAHSQTYKIANLGKANLLHLLRSDNFQSRKRASAAGHRQRKLGRDPFQLGGTFIFGPGNVDRFAHLSQTFGDNASPQSLLAAL
ncbi:MAG TPA: peroxiredoxin-like family protein [Candidatus Limnocylindrales bacterium]|nr:peroxiredoxin-like family protein [Candidatus Limnocylindrales bacterium]